MEILDLDVECVLSHVTDAQNWKEKSPYKSAMLDLPEERLVVLRGVFDGE